MGHNFIRVRDDEFSQIVCLVLSNLELRQKIKLLFKQTHSSG